MPTRRTLSAAPIIALLTMIGILAACTPATDTSSLTTTATAIDGDTIQTADGTRVRLLGIDTPEVGQRCAKAATAYTTNWLTGPITISDYGTDRYGRTLAYVTNSRTGNDLGTDLLAASLARPRYDAYDGWPSHPEQDAYRAYSADISC